MIDQAATLEPWEQALLIDHHLSVEVQVGGARRAARMATKSWRDAGILRFIRCKSEGGLWTANHSVMVDAEFWQRVRSDAADSLTRHARAVFEEATRCAWINGEPGFINGDALEDHRTGTAWDKPVHEDGRDFRSSRYQADEAAGLLAEVSRRAASSRFPVTTNPCGEIALHVTGGYCVIADFAPLLACPVPLEQVAPGQAPDDVAALWDARVEDSVRLGVRFLMRANGMDALYGQEVARTNRMGIGPTGLHEWAWLRFGLDFNDLLDEARSAPFWAMVGRLSEAAKREGGAYADELGRARPTTVTTVKPAGTTSKLFGLTEGAHLPARRQYLRWVQFKGVRDPESGEWAEGSDPLLARICGPRLSDADAEDVSGHDGGGVPDGAAAAAARAGRAERDSGGGVAGGTVPVAAVAGRALDRRGSGQPGELYAEDFYRPARPGVVPGDRAGTAAAGALLRGAAEPAGS